MSEPTRTDGWSARERVILGGLIAWSDARFTLSCSFKDVSDEGARLQLPAGAILPERFSLIEFKTGLGFEAQTMWRRPPQIGVKFLSTIDLRQPVAEEFHHLRRLWLERAPR